VLFQNENALPTLGQKTTSAQTAGPAANDDDIKIGRNLQKFDRFHLKKNKKLGDYFKFALGCFCS
jgi:hypothetical protein